VCVCVCVLYVCECSDSLTYTYTHTLVFAGTSKRSVFWSDVSASGSLWDVNTATKGPQKLPVPSDMPSPLSLAQTEFHFVLLEAHRVLAVHKVSREVVWEHNFSSAQGDFHSLVYDPIEDWIFLASTRGVFELEVENEGVGVWRLFLAANRFKEALNTSRTAQDRLAVTQVLCTVYACVSACVCVHSYICIHT
jgi:hypothetical protein